jgi:flagellar FliJ protein
MRSSSVVKALKEIAAKEVDLAAEALTKAIKVVEEAESKYNMLCQYREDYLKNQNALMESGMGAEVYRNFQNFFNKLDSAFNAQAEALEFAKRQARKQRDIWQESQRKKLSYDVLAKRSDNREQKVQLKKDQNMMDEFAMRVSRVRHS